MIRINIKVLLVNFKKKSNISLVVKIKILEWG